MFDLHAGLARLVSAPFFLADGVTDGTVAGSQVWTVTDATLATLVVQPNGSVEILPGVARGAVTLNYTASGVNDAGVTVPLFGAEIFNILDAVIIPPAPVQVAFVVSAEQAPL